MPIYALSIHADYRCGHSGACCTAGWPIPVERTTSERLRELVGSGEVVVGTAREAPFFWTRPDLPFDTPVLTATRPDGACAFYERGSGLCAIHRQAGEPLMPVACRQFPRVSLVDDRGLFVNLSHYCPTAAGLLFRDDTRLGIVEAPPAFPPAFQYDPLDARAEMPPLLTPMVLLDHEAFARWETKTVELFAADNLVSAEECLAAVTSFTEDVRGWKPADGPLAEYVEELAARGPGWPEPPTDFDAARVLQHSRIVLDSIPPSHRPALELDRVAEAYRRWIGADWRLFVTPVRRYLAAKAFASWLAYQGRGLRTIVFSLSVALSLLKLHAALACESAGRCLDAALLVTAVRRTDEMLLHLASRQALAGRLGRVENVAGRVSSGVR